MIIALRIAFAIVIFTSGAYAQTAEECVGINDPNDRLNCFDAAFTETVTTPPANDVEWTVRTETSALDDSTSVYISVYSDERVQDRFGNGGLARLMVRCRENTTAVTIHFAGLFMADIQGRGRVDFRVDDNPPSHVNMTASTANEHLGLWNGNRSIPFIRNHLLDGENLYVRATPFSENPVEMSFNISGLNDVIVPLREACSW